MKRIFASFLIVSFTLLACRLDNAFCQTSILAELTAGIEAYDNFEYSQAVDHLIEATRSGKLNRNDQLQGLEYLAACYLIQNEKTPATEIIKRIIDIDPGYKMDETKFEGRIVADYNTYFQQIKGQYLVSNVTISSNPVGATLLLDGYQRSGETPITLAFITSGEHTFTMQKENCNTLTKVQTVKTEMADQEISFDLACKFVQPPDAEPRIDIPPVKEKKSSKKWLLIGGGVLLAGGIAAVALSGGGDDGGTEEPDLNLPPAFPGGD